MPNQDFLTMADLGTVGGATVATVLVTNMLRSGFGWTSLAIPLIMSLALAGLKIIDRTSLGDPTAYILTLINGALLYCAATGANATFIQLAGKTDPGAAEHGKQKPKFFSQWTTKRTLG